METEDTKTVREIPRTLSGFTFFLLKEIWRQKKWFLLPLWILLAALALVIVLGGGSSLLPVIYIAF